MSLFSSLRTHFKWPWLITTALLLAGCHGRDSIAYTTWATPDQPYSPQGDSANAFDGYAQAAIKVEQDAQANIAANPDRQDYLNGVWFTAFTKRRVIKVSQPALVILRRAAGRSCNFEFRSMPPFVVPPYQRGWRLLGRSLAWTIQNAVEAGDYDKAISDTVLATKFGFDLTGGSAMDASLGFAIADEARKSIAPALPKMGASQLGNLANGIKRALESKPPIAKVIDNEHKNMLLAVQTVQDAYRDNRWEDLRRNLGHGADDAIQYLQDLKPSKASAYFQGFAREAEDEIAYLQKAAKMPANDRDALKPPKYTGERPWKHFSKDFFYVGRPLLAINNESLARTRLLALNADLTKLAKAVKSVPSSLGSFPAVLTMDPYSGRSFIYHAQSMDFNVYSVGANHQDDGGETDESFSDPDLVLER